MILMVGPLVEELFLRPPLGKPCIVDAGMGHDGEYGTQCVTYAVKFSLVFIFIHFFG